MDQPNINTGIGKAPIDDFRKTTYSKRASEGKLNVVKANCPNCHHTKLFTGNNLEVKGQGIIKCCRCKHIISSL